MAKGKSKSGNSNKGFASMSKEKRTEIARKGGQSKGRNKDNNK